MPTVTVRADAPATDADRVFATICDFARYPAHTPSVREVEVRPVAAGVVDSTWSVVFRSGLLRWSERDHVDHERRTITFAQTSGDFDTFTGSWTVEQVGPDSRIDFSADFDLGMPTLAPIIDPIAASTLVENLQAVLRGLLRVDLSFESGVAVGPAVAVGVPA
jgi:ribosome-associated toxin RatA of RatAB toxin-antitoxin module